MRALAVLTLSIAGFGLATPSSLHAHGGQYRGPGDTVPPGGNSGGPGVVSGPGVAGPSGPGGTSPGANTPGSRAPGNPGNAPSPGAVTGFGDSSLDLTQWSFWWEFNKDPYLDLKRYLHEQGGVTGSETWFLGHGETSQARDSLRPSELQIRETVVPALLAALESETNNDIVTGCMIALAKIGDPPEETDISPIGAVLARFFADKYQEISETTAVALGILAHPSSIRPLAELMDDGTLGRQLVARHEVPLRTRALAAYGLGLIGARCAQEEDRQEIVRRLWACLASADARARDLQVACVIALGMTPVATLEAPAGAAPELARTAQVEHLLAFLRDRNQHWLVRAHVPTALARLVSSELPAELHERLRAQVVEAMFEYVTPRSKEPGEIFQSVTLALGLLGTNDLAEPLDQRILELLSQLAKDGEPQTKRFALLSLARVGGRTAAGARDSEGGIERITKTLLKALAEGKGEMSWAALACGVLARELSTQGNQSVRIASLQGAVRSALGDERVPERIGALAIAAGIMRDVEASPELRRRLANLRDDEARGYVALGLGLMNAREAVLEIETLVRESKFRPALLKQSAIALGLLGDKGAVEVLAGQLADAKGLATQASLSSALGFIGDRRSIEPLVGMLKDEQLTERARGFAAAALGIVADRSPLPWNSTISRDLNYRASTSTLTDAGSGTGILDLL